MEAPFLDLFNGNKPACKEGAFHKARPLAWLSRQDSCLSSWLLGPFISWGTVGGGAAGGGAAGGQNLRAAPPPASYTGVSRHGVSSKDQMPGTQKDLGLTDLELQQETDSAPPPGCDFLQG